MKNLNDLGVQEMDAKEMEKTDGGILPLMLAAAAYIIWVENPEWFD